MTRYTREMQSTLERAVDATPGLAVAIDAHREDALAKLRAENERLRAALKSIQSHAEERLFLMGMHAIEEACEDALTGQSEGDPPIKITNCTTQDCTVAFPSLPQPSDGQEKKA